MLRFILNCVLRKLLRVNAKIQHSYGKAERMALPQIQPFGYGLNVNYTKNSFNAEISSEGPLQQNRFRAAFGETASLAYNLLNAVLTRQFQISKQNILVKAGVEIFFDKSYRTFSHWNNIPRMGGNYFLNFVYKF